MASKNYNEFYMAPDIMGYVYRRKISNTRSNIAHANDYHLYETERDFITECYRVLFNIVEVPSCETYTMILFLMVLKYGQR